MYDKMPVYILRHEERLNENSFNSSLTKRGLHNAINLADRLHTLNIDTIYCSPFIRAIQTVHPYSITYNVPINIENSLIEFLERNDIVPYKQCIIYNKKEQTYWNLNHTYKSQLSSEIVSQYQEQKKVETMNDVKYRVSKFIDYLLTVGIKQNILLVSHKTPLYFLWNYIHSQSLLLEMGEIAKLIA